MGRVCRRRFRTKGEMIQLVAEAPGFAGLARSTVSCARWKRLRVQCGHCRRSWAVNFGDHHDRAIGPDVKQRDLRRGQMQSGV